MLVLEIGGGKLLRILRIVDRTNPPNLTAIGLHAQRLSIDLRAYEIESTVLTTAERGFKSYSRVNDFHNFRVWPYITIAGNRIAPSFLPRILRALKSQNFDLIHVHSHLFFTSLCGCIAGLARKKKIVITNHGLIQPMGKLFDVAQLNYAKLLFRLLRRIPSYSICYSHFMKNEMANLGFPIERIIVIPNGVDTEVFNSQVSKIETQNPVLGFVGRLTAGKGIILFLRICRELSDHLPDLQVKIVGTGKLLPRMKSFLAENNLIDKVELLGQVPYSEMPNVMRSLSVLVLPTEREGVSRTMLEAMACGVPVVISKIPGIEKITRGGAICVPRKKSSFVSEILRILRSKSQAENLIEKGREVVEINYSWNKIVERTARFYRSICQT